VREAIRRCIRESDEIHWRANKEPPPYSNQTAVHAMQHKVVCTGRANLLAALLRSAGIPARILGGAPARFKSVATHFIVEAYLPGFGWYPIEPTVLAEGLEPQSQINWSIAGPAYESEGNAGWRSYIGGGVPYLSCNEINLPRGAFRYVGAIDDAGADNRATSLLPLESGRKDWKRVMELARQHWKNESKDLATQRSPSSSSLSRFLNKIQ
jgi:transglutaminase-like putative cysteine protease